MSNLIKYDISTSYGEKTVTAKSKGVKPIECANVEEWCRASDVDSYIESLKSELAEQKSINNDLLWELADLDGRGLTE